MADNTVINAGSGGDTIGTDEVLGVKYQRIKNGFGADGSYADVSAADPLPVVVMGGTTDALGAQDTSLSTDSGATAPLIAFVKGLVSYGGIVSTYVNTLQSILSDVWNSTVHAISVNQGILDPETDGGITGDAIGAYAPCDKALYNGVLYPIKHAAINDNSGAQFTAVDAVSGKKLLVLALTAIPVTATTTVSVQSNATNLSGPVPGGVAWESRYGQLITAAGEALKLTPGAAERVAGHVLYAEVD